MRLRRLRDPMLWLWIMGVAFLLYFFPAPYDIERTFECEPGEKLAGLTADAIFLFSTNQESPSTEISRIDFIGGQRETVYRTKEYAKEWYMSPRCRQVAFDLHGEDKREQRLLD